ncbi:G-type lectin S-receptor-like serine/threonine-protein kinase LECRK3 [Fagus crenata]
MDTTNWGSQLIFTEAGYMYIIDGGNGRNLSLTKEDPGSNETYYHIARIDHDGVFRIYKHLRKKDETSGGSCPPSWTEVQGIPEDICQAFLCIPQYPFVLSNFCGLLLLVP